MVKKITNFYGGAEDNSNFIDICITDITSQQVHKDLIDILDSYNFRFLSIDSDSISATYKGSYDEVYINLNRLLFLDFIF